MYCSPPTTIINGDHNGSPEYTAVGNVITYACDALHTFPDGDNIKYVTCLSTGEYDEEIPNCEGWWIVKGVSRVNLHFLILDFTFLGI